jgi:hypothetical protein
MKRLGRVAPDDHLGERDLGAMNIVQKSDWVGFAMPKAAEGLSPERTCPPPPPFRMHGNEFAEGETALTWFDSDRRRY